MDGAPVSGNDHLYREIGKLRDEIEEKDAIISSLKKSVIASKVYPPEFNLSHQQKALLDCLRATRGICQRESLFAAIGMDEAGGRKAMDAAIFWLRHKLESINVKIETIRGVGYLMSGQNKKALETAILHRVIGQTRNAITIERRAARASEAACHA